MTNGKQFVIDENSIKDLVHGMGYSICSNKITIDGEPVGFMYREEPVDDEDSGWRFLAGTESQEFADDPDNSKIVGVNTVANIDPSIIPYIKMPVGTELEKIEGKTEFKPFVFDDFDE
jgi:hypothetical protein